MSRKNMTDLEAMSSTTLSTVAFLMHRLVAKGVLKKTDVNLIFDSVLAPHESSQSADDPVSLRIRKLADEMAQVILQVRKPPQPPRGK